MSDDISPSIWPCLSFRDARAAVAFLTDAFGFELRCMYTADDDPDVVHHGEMRLPGGGGIMFGSTGLRGPNALDGKDDTPFGRRVTGNDAIYVVCDDPDTLFKRATEAGAEVVRELRDEDYGSRGFTVHDPEGNLWSFGTYRGE